MASDVVKDYLGHPCRFTQAQGHFAEPLADAHQKDLRDIKRDVGRLLLELSERLSYSQLASRAIADMTSPIPDADEPHAMMEMLTSYELDTANLFWNFAGLVLAGLEHVEGGGRNAAPANGRA